MLFLHVEYQIRWVPDTHPISDGYGYEYKFLPTGIGPDTNFYAQLFY
jgi:hypothetical protein